ncbi:MAG: hypothetical protein CM15mP49_15950 [Actinomycetota bacterium]|nr:MAG: hypothetical protein CM15mP49_15950 [Actinomycetota bacterium]
MGFVEETGAAQHYRDIRIAGIYEGTNGIQAIDLVGRKLSMRKGDVVRELLLEINETASELHSANLRESQDLSKMLLRICKQQRSGSLRKVAQAQMMDWPELLPIYECSGLLSVVGF